MRLTRERWTAALGMLVITAVLHAEPPNPGACKADVAKLCPDIAPGGGRVVQCLKQHETDLSAECKQNISAMKDEARQRIDALRQACKADDEKFCANVKPMGGQKIDCLKTHLSEISSACKNELAKVPPRRGAPSGQPPQPPAK